MITGGISFQPSADDPQKKINPATNASHTQEGVQEAIKVLSLRLPKVVGANAVAPGQLLNSQGSGGRPHVDSMVESVMQKFFPTGGVAQPMAPGQPMTAPQFDGAQNQTPRPMQREPDFWSQERTPQIIADLPPMQEWFGLTPFDNKGPRPQIDGGGFLGGGPSAIDRSPVPDLRQQLDWLPQQPQRDDTPLI